MDELKILESNAHEINIIEKSIVNLYDGHKKLDILEAGCGRNWPLKLGETKYKLIGVDLDKDALNSRVNIKKDLDESIVSDLQEFDLGSRKVDVIYNAFVLEHVENATKMLENFSHSLKPGGLLILRLPDRNTVFGFITRLSPFWFHVWYKKHVQGLKNAGKPGFAPYPTYYNPVVSREGIYQFCQKQGFKINQEYGSCDYLRRKSLKLKLIKLVAISVHFLSFGKLPWRYNNLTYILTKT